MKKLFLGVDTSNYTTSVALCDEEGKITANIKKLLPVAEGQRGLRQSEALFHHTAALPEITESLKPYLSEGEIAAVGVSTRPRDAEGSYMPCFLAGKNAAYAAAVAAKCRIYEFSHQCGHIAAALYSADRCELFGDSFFAFHVSGGTTDVLSVSPDEKNVFRVERIGGTLDLNAGQVIDRAGVMMGLKFPCGASLEKAALSYSGTPDRVSVSVKGVECNLSGAENKAEKLYLETGDKERCAAYVISYVCRTLMKMTENLRSLNATAPIIYAGGVMSCSLIKKELSRFGSFAQPEFSSDNAAGIALMTRNKYYGL